MEAATTTAATATATTATTTATTATTVTTTTAVPSPPAPADDLDDSRRSSRPPRATAAVEKPPHQAPQGAPPLHRSCRFLTAAALLLLGGAGASYGQGAVDAATGGERLAQYERRGAALGGIDGTR
uniref:Uncharacterized protein n=1 Tax=Oryza rufipogon TaxID=4529 RepID=A0A0E0NGM0_ORYRU